MQNLIEQEKFELEVLDNLNSYKLLDKLIFTGGTMLRLCYGLDRYSIDLDFWIVRKTDLLKLFKLIKNCLLNYYTLKDSADKHNTLLFEIKSANYPNRLKIEIRKAQKKVSVEKSIAYSKSTNRQVLLNTVSLNDMMEAKTDAFLERKEIRDAFDIEFLLKKGIILKADEKKKKRILETLKLLTPKDYKVKLGSIVEQEIRGYYISENFKILKSYL
jgi:predicted nucleotidyltransferase component of viral defense system